MCNNKGTMRAFLSAIQNTLTYELSLAAMAVASVAMLVWELLGSPAPESILLMHRVDLLIALVFLVDFTVGISISRTRKQYFKENWLNLVSSIPVTNNLYRSLRILRIFRTLRLLRTLAVISNAQRITAAVKDVSSTHKTEG
jgi:voltage-gated potassium channel